MSQAIAALPASSSSADWTDEERAVIEAAGLVFTHAYGERKGDRELAPRAVIARFQHTCARTGLDPLARQIYCIGRFGSDGLEWSIQTGIDGFRVVAERSKQYAGQAPAEWLTESGEWVDVFVKKLHGEHPLAARVKVYRHDWDKDKPAVGIATWDEYAQTKRNGDLTAMWAQRGPGQLAKCAEALAMRKAFPQDLSGVYTDDELRPTTQDAPEMSENWESLIAAADSEEALALVGERIAESGQGTDKIRAAYRARSAMLLAAANTEDAEIVVDETPVEVEADTATSPTSPSTGPTAEEYEAAASAEYDAAVARGEVAGRV
jgi:phage recombination protein Bet